MASEPITSSAWPPNDTLTAEKLLALHDAIQTPEWLRMIREADVVTVMASEYLPGNDMLVMAEPDPLQPDPLTRELFGHSEPERRVLIIVPPARMEEVTAEVDALRATEEEESR